jgi:DNA primase
MDRFEHVKERVKEANELVSLIESYLPLRRRGRTLVALCPFHEEKTPSFTVYPDSQHYKCYGCGRAGDVFTFVMEREGLGFREALEMLGERAGIATAEAFGGGARKDAGAGRTDAAKALDQVREFFQAQLRTPGGATAREYLRKRGLEAAIEPFGLGAHPEQPGALLAFARERRLPREVLEQAGLLATSQREDGELWEPFRGRVMFPIVDERGRVVGFGGRLLGDGPRKYINSSDAPFFRKGRILYGLHQAKRAGARRIVVMEGYTDVIACHLAGFAGAVATLGTAFTPEHARMLHRYATDGVVLLFDGDRAGRSAAERAFAELAKTELGVRIALLDEGVDPADMLGSSDGAAKFAALIESADDALTTWFRIKRRSLDLTLEANVARVLEECGRVLDAVADPARRAVLLGRMAAHLGLDQETARRSLAARRKRPAARPKEAAADAAGASGQASGPEEADLELIACLLADPTLAARLEAGQVYASAAAAQLAELVAELAPRAPPPGELVRSLFTRCAPDPDLSRCLARCLDMAAHIREPLVAFEGVLAARKTYFSRQAAQRTRIQLQKAREEGDHALVDELTRTYLEHLRQA